MSAQPTLFAAPDAAPTRFSGPPSGAVLSPCERYRYQLWRTVGEAERRVAFVMLNPSTADAAVDDPTIRRCIGFARAWGFGRLDVVNLFGWRATDPSELDVQKDPVGPGNDGAIRETAFGADLVVCAWGVRGGGRAVAVRQLLAKLTDQVVCLELTKGGHPKHPLDGRGDVQPVRFLLETS